jgi:hypothetical protein
MRTTIAAVSLGIVALWGMMPDRVAAQHHTVVHADAVKWGPAPPSLPPGAQGAILLGNPAAEGPFVLRLKFPAGFIVPPHRHSKDELVPAQSFIHLPAGMTHYAWAEVESVVQINGVGPFDVTYVDPADDPRKK